MKKYLSFFQLEFTMGLQYRIAALAGVITQFFWGFMEIMIFYAFYQGEPSAFPMSFSATATYIWLQQAFFHFFIVWNIDNEILDSIVTGNIAYQLCRPINIYNMWFFKAIASRVSRTLLRCFPILVTAPLLPSPYGISAPASCFHFLLFLLTLLLGLLVTVSFCMLIYVMAFFTISPQGLRILFSSITEFFTGAMIPLPFFPEKMQKIMELLPFAAMQNVALRIYSGSMTSYEMQKAIILQIFWLFMLIMIGKLLCRFAEKKITIQGS